MIETGAHIPVRRITPRVKTLGDLFRQRCAQTPNAPAVYEKRGADWEKLTWGDLYERARRAANGLVKVGVERGDRVAILGPTRATWGAYDMASQLVGATSFGIYPKQTKEQVRYLLEHSEAKVVFVDEKSELETVLAAAEGLVTLEAIVPWDDALFAETSGRDKRLRAPSEFRDAPLSDEEIARRLDALSPEDTAIFVYTSGTTGPPKGAMISHVNILSLLAANSHSSEFFEDDLSLNFLPMAHAAERVFGFFARIDTGVATAYARSIGTVLEDVGDVKPTLFGAVPRIFEKAYAKVQSELAKKPPAVRRLFAWAVNVGKRAFRLEIAGDPVPPLLRAQRALADRLVFRRIRAAFGGRVRFFITGAAPIAMEILEFFWAAGLPIYEVYGMTEATVATHVNRPGAVKLGTVGRALSPIEVKVAEDGEILMRGPWVFSGYYKSPEATAEALQDGWLHTGDIGTVDGDGYLKITDRKKHLIITSGGKNLAPANIENAIKNQDPLISHVYAHGDRRAFVAAVIAPSPLETLQWGEERGLVSKAQVATLTRELMESPASRSSALNAAMALVVAHAAFAERLRDAVRKGNRDLAGVEQVRRFVVLDRDFSQEAGELTPTMKLKRKAVEQIHAELIEKAYGVGGIDVT